ncbi:LCP family protein [Streptomyces polyrhachis]|uniref:LCP family protein n=1 Tax=Streptomyces polyrhachis TaxID=1282885 RepID=A0ABW2GD63_9ACTN
MRRLPLLATLLAVLATGGTVQAVSADTFAAGTSDRAAAGGTNILVAGVDTRRGLSRETINKLHVGGEGCDCTDVLMLVHLSADGKRASAVSLLRDSYVEFAPHDHPRHHGKINGAYQHGGPDLAMRTVERATGLKVDHYLQADFPGFAAAVDDLGGATVCTAEPLADKNSGLRLDPGTHHVDGNGALRYARARHVPPPGDGGRVRRQHRLLAGMLERLRTGGAFADLPSAARTARTLLRSVRTDPGTSPLELARLGLALGKVRDTEFATVPVADWDHRVPQWGSTVRWHGRRAATLWKALREDRPVTGDQGVLPGGAVAVDMPPTFVQVRAADGRVARALRANGFDVRGRGPVAAAGGERTVITYDPRWQRYAPTLAAALPGARLDPVAGHGPVFDVRPGTDRQRTARVVFDRTAVQGAPVSGESLLCR